MTRRREERKTDASGFLQEGTEGTERHLIAIDFRFLRKLAAGAFVALRIR